MRHFKGDEMENYGKTLSRSFSTLLLHAHRSRFFRSFRGLAMLLGWVVRGVKLREKLFHRA